MSAGTPQRLPHHCPYCANTVLLEVLSQWHNIPEEDDSWEPHQWTMARCESCYSPFVFYQEPDYGPDGAADWGIRQQEFPKADRVLPSSVPEGIRRDFSEAQRCMRVLAYTAAAIMARRVLDAIRKDHGYPRGSLYDALKTMRDDGVIDHRFHEWADSVRQVGNDGAHESDVVMSRDDAEETLAFVEALIDYLYVFRDRHARFMRRRRALRGGRDPDMPTVLTLPGAGAGRPSDAGEQSVTPQSESGGRSDESPQR